MENDSSLIYKIALTQINGVGDITARNLLNFFGNEENIFKSTKKDLLAVNGISHKLIEEILNPEVFRKAEKELEFIVKNKIRTFFINDKNYPSRLKECIDAPILLYFKGNYDLNAEKIIGIVGTRKSTEYGNSFCKNFLEEVASHFSDILIISGLAYGIDINAHRSAVNVSLPTIGVLAHGLDRIYPQSHRKMAIQMLGNGGLLTEFPSNTEPDKFNFVRRNRIIAGMCDALIVVESDLKGGSLITAEIANSYNKEVFAVPGRLSDTYSRGCNKLIEKNKALLFESVSAFFRQMNWDGVTTSFPKQQKLLFNLSSNEQSIYDIIIKKGAIHINALSMETDISMSQLFSDLFEMEMKCLIKSLPGGIYDINNKY